MNENFKITKEVNLKGVKCPITLVKTKMQMEELKVGEILKVIFDAKSAIEDVPASLKLEGHSILDVSQINETDWQVIIKKEK